MEEELIGDENIKIKKKLFMVLKSNELEPGFYNL